VRGYLLVHAREVKHQSNCSRRGGGGFLQVAPSETSTFQWYLQKTRMADDGIKDLHVIVVASFSVSIFRGSVEIESPQ
jgi:hypothetical protein